MKLSTFRFALVTAFVVFLLLALFARASETAQPTLGPASSISSTNPAPDPLRSTAVTHSKTDAAGNVTLSVNGASREEVRQFYNSVYLASENVPMDSTANTSACVDGANSDAFQDAVQWRINWFRAMAGIPADITFSQDENVAAQSAALMLSANNQLQHDIPTTWSCYDANGAAVALKSNIALGLDGPDAITGYIWDYGSDNYTVGHRRWILYPQTQVMATGDVPAQGGYQAANDTVIEDSNYGTTRPTTTYPFVAWPPPGYVPCQVVYPQWSFAYAGGSANVSVESVTMLSNGVPMSIKTQFPLANYGEPTLVWYPANLDPTSYNTRFPFDGHDTVYTITVSNIQVQSQAQPVSVTYYVTNFDPGIPGADFVPTQLSGPTIVTANAASAYSCTASANPHTTGYQWLLASVSSSDLTDRATNGLVNFTFSPASAFSVISNPPVGSGKCFHLTHSTYSPQLLQLNETLLPKANSQLTFQSYLGYATSYEVARVQISTNGGKLWTDVFAQAGNGTAQGSFSTQKISLAAFAGEAALVRFNYDYTGLSSDGAFYTNTGANYGWSIENIVLTNVNQLTEYSTNHTDSPTFTFTPSESGSWAIEARPVIFGEFGLDWSGALTVSTPVSIISQPASASVTAGGTATFTVGALGAGTLQYQWLFDGTNIAGATSSALTLKNAQSAQAGSYGVVVTSGVSTEPSSLATLTVTPKLGPLKITSQPKSVTSAVGSNITFSVLAIGESALKYQWARNGVALVDGGEYSGSTNAVLSIEGVEAGDAGSYTVTVSDSHGSAKSAAAILTVTAPMTVQVSSGGTVTPNYNGEMLTVGKVYTMTAKPASGYLFGGWTGSVNTNSAAVKFTFDGSDSLTASFYANPFVDVAGSYYGLFGPDGSPRNQTNSGAITFTLSRVGAFSGKLTIGANVTSFTGQLSQDGTASITVPRRGQSTLTIALQLDFATDVMTGTIGDGDFSASLLAHLQIFSAANSATVYDGKYTVVIPGSNKVVGPFGTSYGTVTISKTGAITFVGSLADGTAVTESSYLSSTGYWPLYIPLYSGNGSLWSWNFFDMGYDGGAFIVGPSSPVLSSTASWIDKTNTLKTALYKSGFTNDPATIYVSPFSGASSLNVPAAQVVLTLENAFTNTIPISIAKGKVSVTGSNTNKLSLTINSVTGAVTGSFTAGSKTPIKINGVFLPNATNAAGYFISSNQSGLFLLTPQP